ncbi:MAG TPA: RyR domain-containing protein [Candidatus Sulfotelmatobacter sp.]|nr:RyR domain-containing protein [Candidatus Sulfotelmatobacter sp.]
MDPSKYKPQPVDTSAIELDEGLRAIIEALARNNHEVWARARAAEGWKYGPERNDARKEHPGLVPYEQLSEGEKEIDRGTVLQTLKAAVALGAKVRPEKESSRPVDKELSKRSADDISEWPPWPQGEALAALEKTRDAITDVYHSADKSAGVNLKWHRVVAITIALAGTYAVITAILQLYAPGRGDLAGWIELILAGLAVLALIAGLLGKFMRKWLVFRHQAERCRFLKFDFLLETALAGRDRTKLKRIAHHFQELAQEIGRVDLEDMEDWLKKEHVLQKPLVPSESEFVSHDLRTLAEHYLKTRLEIQSNYFSKQSKRDSLWNWQSQDHVPMLFAASICFAVAHFAVERWHLAPEQNGRFLTLLAACFPVIGAGVRALRGISEPSRNNLRFTAKCNALKELIEELEREMAGPAKSSELVRLLWKGEQILEGEHREWLRLMMEAEWIG